MSEPRTVAGAELDIAASQSVTNKEGPDHGQDAVRRVGPPAHVTKLQSIGGRNVEVREVLDAWLRATGCARSASGPE
jgi:hypothetical protein